ncbi:hypothetical protein BH10PAT3_BH10PAT3_7360 [soil metagenome]
MKKSLTVRRMIENEVIFRQYNEHIQNGFEELKEIAEAEGQPLPDSNLPAHFYCECSDENCRERISITMAEYKRIHKSKKRFIVIPGHDNVLCEFVVRSTRRYSIVQKYNKPPAYASTLKPTLLDNT